MVRIAIFKTGKRAPERVEYRRGRLLNFTEGAQVWADDYETAGWVTQPAATS